MHGVMSERAEAQSPAWLLAAASGATQIIPRLISFGQLSCLQQCR